MAAPVLGVLFYEPAFLYGPPHIGSRQLPLLPRHLPNGMRQKENPLRSLLPHQFQEIHFLVPTVLMGINLAWIGKGAN